ncbi:hepatocyte growth factor-regulated tyrosine kinase substrate-like isoform X1 [Macrosteles quadrilineatus]|uniref:hepatocyte growth factor-regulated tyrosine kinase substrate-like isoform X1 n=2 Tax=Macrosteles quadrilineatus TaxID=74068 RepID=UPI0023E1A203|nr:hepatocyte growth factor-regulated tyrosine kinase substrate-like isoform X1 [Macrosteles quadrilineatus]
MFRSTSSFDKLLDKATSHLRLEPDWPVILQICDQIRQGDVQPKYALAAIKKKLINPNPHVALFGLIVLESCVKNCGSLIHDEIGTKPYMEQLRELVRTSPHENVRSKVLELIQAWAFAFRNSPKYRAVQDTMNIMKAGDYKFPPLKESDAMFSADTAPAWADGDCCHRCRVQFGMVQRKHHCRACGQVFCSQCSAKTCTLPKFGIEKEVRVCEACYNKNSKPATPKKQDSTEELPVEYLTSSLAQQNQAPPPRKSEDELKEEEELQLALALSQSEAEHKEKHKTTRSLTPTSRTKSYSPPPVRQEVISPPIEEDPELARYLNRSYWENRGTEESSPSAPAPISSATNMGKQLSNEMEQNGVATDSEMEEFVRDLKSQVEIFVNRMKSNSSRGRSIANDSSVQKLFMNITAMHSKLLHYIQQQDDSRVYYEGLQDKLVQVKDARAALDALRDEHREKLRREAELAERQRQHQMAQKLDIMRKKKQEYLQYQRQLTLQRIQEQEREMQLRQEQQKQQYLMSSQYAGLGYMPPGGYESLPPGGYVMGGPVPAGYSHPHYTPAPAQGMPGMMMPGYMGPPHGMVGPQMMGPPSMGPASLPTHMGSSPVHLQGQIPPHPQQGGQIPQQGQFPQQQGQIPQQQGQIPQQQGQLPQQQGQIHPQQGQMPNQGQIPPQGQMPHQGQIPPQQGQIPSQPQGIPPQIGNMGLPNQGPGMPPNQIPQMVPQSGPPMLPGAPSQGYQHQQPQPQISQPQSQIPQPQEQQTAELISFD